MRFGVELLLEENKIPKDKNRIFLSLLKNCFKSYSEKYYEQLYKEAENKTKEFTFSLYMGNCKFLRDEIEIPNRKIYLNFSTYSNEDGIMFYNSILECKGKKFPIKNNTMRISRLNIRKEKPFYSDEAIFKTLSPIVVREHKGCNEKTWYHSLNTKKGQSIFLDNLRYQLIDIFGEKIKLDFEDISLEVLKGNKEVKVKNYGIEVLSNVAKLKIKAKPYILDYLYKAGIGSKRGSGFGMLDIV
ncbi:MAG: CRISPR-associated endoribonuclease Cas6 [Firmicutes bacterium]|nr:CRISPR-associated endoribonuclease Cas6 [Bacillota bacterium]